MDGLDLGALIGLGALVFLLAFILPAAWRHDRRTARRRCAGDDGAMVAGVGAFGGDGGAGCSDGGGGSC